MVEDPIWQLDLFWLEDTGESKVSTLFRAKDFPTAQEHTLLFIRNRQICLRGVCWQRLGALKLYVCDIPRIDQFGKLSNTLTQFPLWEWKYDTHPQLEGVT